MGSWAGRDVLSLGDVTREEFDELFAVADSMEPIARERQPSSILQNRILVTAFYQPSTRTRLAHESAMVRLGGSVVGFADAKSTRAGDFYQESIKDTAHMLEHYGDVIVMRHYAQGAPQECAQWSSIPVINAGDGWGEHPTQVLTDLFTVRRERGTIDGLTFVAVGDWRMRTMHSLSRALTKFDAELLYVCPDDMAPTEELLGELAGSGFRPERVEHIADALDRADVIYVEPVVQADYTKGRVERSGELPRTAEEFRIDAELLRNKAKPDSIVLHSLPRMDELATDVDDTPHARYWEEAFNGVVMRMALLATVLDAV
ncbi:MAG: aspartate carbamoyltransferase [Actinomycetota bacterium]